jgi:PAS domain-containing protein
MLNLGPAGFDFTPVGFTFGGLLVGTSLFRCKLPEIVPVAHGTLIEGISDSIIVLDAENRILELNPAARRMLGVSSVAAGPQRAARSTTVRDNAGKWTVRPAPTAGMIRTRSG